MAASRAVGDFIEAPPHTLTIELAPPTPVPLLALRGAMGFTPAIAQQLGLTISANRP